MLRCQPTLAELFKPGLIFMALTFFFPKCSTMVFVSSSMFPPSLVPARHWNYIGTTGPQLSSHTMCGSGTEPSLR